MAIYEHHKADDKNMDFYTPNPESCGLSESEERRVRTLVVQWVINGKLVFDRQPNLVTMVAVISILGLQVYVLLHSMLTKVKNEPTPDYIYILLFGLLCCIWYLAKQFSLVRNGNSIILSNDAFSDIRVNLFGKQKHLTIPWASVEARELSSSHDSLILSLLWFFFDHGRVLTITDRRDSKEHRYRSATIQNYFDLRLALITRVGLVEEHEEWEY